MALAAAGNVKRRKIGRSAAARLARKQNFDVVCTAETERRKELTRLAVRGDENAISELKTKYGITSFVVGGQKVF